MRRIAGDWMTAPATQAVMAALTGGGHGAWFVGGCVRDALMGRPVGDIDISTDARPERVIELAEAAGLKAVPTGIDHGTVTLVAGGRPFEVTTFRRDVQTDGRRAVVAFADTMAEDARRRDFTMNALYADADGRVADPLGGLADLDARRIRFIEDPERRIREDYLRILRFFRFHAWLGDPAQGMDPDALAAIAAHPDGIETLSRERIGGEMRKLLAAPDPAPAVAAMRQAGVLAPSLPGADDRFLAPLVHVEQAACVPPRWLRRLAILGGADPAEALRLSRQEAAESSRIGDAVSASATPAALGYRVGAEAAADALLIRAAMENRTLDPEDLAEVRRGAAQTFPVEARDLMPDLTGPALGERLAELEARWIASDFTLTRDRLLS